MKFLLDKRGAGVTIVTTQKRASFEEGGGRMADEIEKELSDAEWEVMKVAWDRGPMAVGEIAAALEGERDWSYSTVKTLVRRMTEKGWLSRRRAGNAFLYRPAVARGKAVRSAVREFSGRVLDGLLAPFVAYYAEEQGLSEEDVAKLEEVLNRHKKEGGKS
jgi:predicted transcriptional regulator